MPAGFTQQPSTDGGGGQGPVLELLTCAHLGLASLYFGDLERARGAALALQRFLDLQPSPASRLDLRMTLEESLVTEFPPEAAPLYRVEAGEPGQAWFFIGYPMAFLCRLHQATGAATPLATARGYGAEVSALR